MGSITRRLVPARLRRNYATKFFLGLLLVTVVASGVGGFVYVNAGEQLQDATEDELTTTASLQRDQIDEWYRGTTSDMQSLRVSVSTMQGQPEFSGEAIENALSATVDRREHVVAAYYGDSRDGELEITSGDQRFMQIGGGGAGTLREPVRQDAVRAMNESGAAIGTTDPFQIGGDETPYMVFATTVNGNLNETIFLIADVRSVSEDSLLDQESGTVVLTDSDGRLLGSTEENHTPLGDATTEGFDPSRGAMRTGATEFAPRVEMNGRAFAVGSAVGESVPWTVATRVPASDAYALQHAISNQMLVLVALVVASLGVLGLTLGRNTVGSVRDLSEAAERLQDGDLEVRVPTGRADEIGDLGRAFDEMRASLRDRIREVEQARTDAEAARQEAEAMRRHLERKADAYEATMTDVAEGDLTARLDPDSRSDAMTSVAAATNRTLAAIEGTVAEAKSFAAAVEAASDSAAASTAEVERASAQVTESVQEISVGADRQHDDLQSVTVEMESLSTSTEQIAATTNDVADRAAATAKAGREGRAAAEDAIAGMADVEAESEEAVEAIEALEAEMAAVDELVEFIADVANQTNMLALNANIEASRGASGDGDGSGEGFAVVAQEVKDLAQETQDAAADVEARLERVREETDRTATEVRATKERVAANAEDVRAAAAALSTVAEHVERTNEGVQEISAATEEQAASAEEVVAMVEEATTISEETSAEAETVAAAAEEQTANLSDVSGRVEHLASQARALSEHLAAFEVADEEVDVDAESAPFQVGEPPAR